MEVNNGNVLDCVKKIGKQSNPKMTNLLLWKVNVCKRLYCVFFLYLISIFVVVYLICFYMWLRVLRNQKVAIYSDGDNIIIIIIIGVFRFKV